MVLHDLNPEIIQKPLEKASQSVKFGWETTLPADQCILEMTRKDNVKQTLTNFPCLSGTAFPKHYFLCLSFILSLLPAFSALIAAVFSFPVIDQKHFTISYLHWARFLPATSISMMWQKRHFAEHNLLFVCYINAW